MVCSGKEASTIHVNYCTVSLRIFFRECNRKNAGVALRVITTIIPPSYIVEMQEYILQK